MSDDELTVAEWRAEVLEELRYREQQMRKNADAEDGEYWSNVANGLSEAQDIVHQVPTGSDDDTDGDSDRPESFAEHFDDTEGDDA